jgi:hypothetical protein
VKTFLAAALLLTTVLAGCSGSRDDDGAPQGGAPAAPVLFMNVTVDGQTYRYTSGGGANGTGNGTLSATATATIGSTGATATGNATGGPTGAGNSTGSGVNVTGNVTDRPSGQAPLNVTVTLGGTGLPASFNWTLDWGDQGAASGNATAGSGGNGTAANATGNLARRGQETGSRLPATLNHTYQAAGTYTIRFSLAAAGANGTAPAASVSTTVLVTAPVGGNTTGNATGNETAGPEVTHYEFGDTLGCTGDLVGNTCMDYAEGPPGSGTDGHWIPLGPAYWGWMLTSTIDQVPAGSDSDCVFVDEALEEIGNANNGGDPCIGEVPENAAWVFLYPYALPASSIVVDFVPA